MVRNRPQSDARTLVAYRAIRETEVFLESSMRSPHTIPRIPAIQVGLGRFTRQFAERFWTNALDLGKS